MRPSVQRQQFFCYIVEALTGDIGGQEHVSRFVFETGAPAGQRAGSLGAVAVPGVHGDQRHALDRCLQLFRREPGEHVVDVEYKKYNAPPRRIGSESGKLRCRLSICSMTKLQPEPVR